MEKDIVNRLDNLTAQQAERLLDENMEMKISRKERKRIKQSVFEKAGLKEKKRVFVPKKMVAWAAAFAIIITSLSLVGFDNVAAAIRDLFTFVPGVGITVKSDDTIYAIDSIVGQVKSGNAKTNIVSAVYAEGYLNVTVEVLGKKLFHDGFTFFVNEEEINYREEEPSNGYVLSVSTDSTMLSFSYKSKAPTKDDLYKISVSGFAEQLSFKMTPCLDYDDIKQIGPTDTQNGISITTTAQKIDGQLVIWCYPFKTADATKDMLLGYGEPANGVFNTLRYIKAESGQIFHTGGGWQLRNRLVFDMPESERSATLHIPYLAMLRQEKKKLTVDIPKDYKTVDSGTILETGLGTIKVLEVQREPYDFEKDRDTVRIYFEFNSKDENARLYSFDYDFGKYPTSVKHFNSETGCLDFLEIYVGKNDKRISLDISQLYYYLFGEYVIPLDIK